MKRKAKNVTVSVLLFAVMVCCMMPLPSSAERAGANIKIGDYIRLGTYENESVLWRCADIDDNGPLMLSDRVICDYLPYDAQTNDNSATCSHRRNGYRSKYGSNHWRDSNMRSWLNSAEQTVTWLCGNPPKAGYVTDGNSYDNKAGFLSGFNKDELSAIKTVTQRSVVSHPEYSAGYIDAPGTDLPYNTDIQTVADGFDRAYYENITDKVFLLDVRQLNSVYKNLGSYYIAKNKNGFNWNCWLRTPVTDCNHDMRYVDTHGNILRDAPYKGYYGVRPAFYLDAEYYTVLSGSGTAQNPYIGSAPDKPDDGIAISGAERETGDGNWDVDTDQNIQLTLGGFYSEDGKYANPTIPVYVIQKPRRDTENMVILFCGEGYTKSQQAKFVGDVRRLWREVLRNEPYRSMSDRFNVYALCTASIDGYGGSSTFFSVVDSRVSTNINGSLKNHLFERCIGPAFIEKIHDAHIPETTNPNEFIWGDEYAPYHYVYEHINQFIVLANSGDYFGGSHDNIKSGIHYIVAPSDSYYSPFILRHELGHGILHLGDEYATSYSPISEEAYRSSLNMSHTGNPGLVKWKNMLGFRSTYSCPHADNSYSFNSSRMCLMRENTRNQLCEVCKLQGTKRMSQLVANPNDLYLAVPEVKEYTGKYRNPSEDSSAFEAANSSGYSQFEADRSSRLLSGTGKSRFTPDMKGREIELRTIVQNLSDTKEKEVTLRLWIKHADGTKATAADGTEISAEKRFTVPVWSEKPKFWPKKAFDYYGSDFDSGLVNCSLVYKIPDNAVLRNGDTVGFAVVDETGRTLADDGTENAVYTSVTIEYKLEDGGNVPNTVPTVIPAVVGAKADYQPLETLNGCIFSEAVNLGETVGADGLTITYYYKEKPVPPAGFKTEYDWGEEFPDGETLPHDNMTYQSEADALAAMDTEYTNQSVSYANMGSLTGKWTFSGWTGKADGAVVRFTGVWTFTPDTPFAITDENGTPADKILKAGAYKARLVLTKERKTAAVVIAKYVNGALEALAVSEEKEAYDILKTDAVTVTEKDLRKQTEIKAFAFEGMGNIKPIYKALHIGSLGADS